MTPSLIAVCVLIAFILAVLWLVVDTLEGQ